MAAVIVDSRNVLHQGCDAIGMRLRPTVGGVRSALARYGFDVAAVHVGLAVARASDMSTLAREHAYNDAYRRQVEADGGDVLLGELHCKRPSGKVEEKMVDGACCVRITRYVDEIRYGRTSTEAIVVLSKDIDLTPAVDYAVQMKVPIAVAGFNVIQHRPHPYALLGPHAYAEIVGAPNMKTGHELRERLTRALADGSPLVWTVKGTLSAPKLVHSCGLVGVSAPGTTLPAPGKQVTLYPIDVTWDEKILGSFPILVCATAKAAQPSYLTAMVRRRPAPMTIEVSGSDHKVRRVSFALGGVVAGETVLIHKATDRALGRFRMSSEPARRFDPDEALELTVVTSLPKGGALVADSSGVRGLLTTKQKLLPGQRIPAVQIDKERRGPVWAAIGTPLL